MGHLPLPWDKPLNEILEFISGAAAILGFVMAAFYRWETENHSKAAGSLLGGIICGTIFLLAILGVV
jgi:hypothetical protein